MESYARNFVRVSVVSLLLGAVLGLMMTISPTMVILRPLHVHFLLLGFMSMMVFGVAYHIIPRFQGHAIIPWAWATLHFFLAVWGLSLLVTGWVAQALGHSVPGLLIAGAVFEILGLLIFLVIMMRGLTPVKKAGE